ncbi:MAG: penicillin-binding transpeptidase domain-containing protein [Planctomycetota bacterium]|nr:penicillin-binding transpeptidase domain-containing protein [Planctomycetota bacterium]
MIQSKDLPADPSSTAAPRVGLRPGLVFLSIGGILALVAARTGVISLAAEGEQPANLRRLPVLPAAFDLCSSDGVPMAGSAEYIELVMSPNAMWQAHTPGPMARALSAALGEPEQASELLARMLPDDAKDGWITCDREPLVLDGREAARVQAWIAGATFDPEKPAQSMQGFALVPGPAAGQFRVAWRPETVLSESERARHGFDKPRDWSRRLGDGLLAAVHGEQPAGQEDTDEERNRARERVWRALIPTQFRVVRKDVPPARAPALAAVLKDERVQPLQMELRRNARRVYPVQGQERGASTPLAVLGRWSTFEPDDARAAAIHRLGLQSDSATWSEADRASIAELSESLIYQPSPTSGLELLSWNLLSKPEFDWIGRRGEEYTFLLNQAPRRPLHRYFQELVPGDPTPRVITTIEIGLQRRVRQLLEETVARHRPALAEAIVVDVATGDVLAVDAIDVYGIGGFAPTMHTFTPGSTFKVPVMACALEEGVITPETTFDSQNGKFRIEGRPIGEAEGGDDKGVVTAAQGLAYSINAVLVQIGTRMNDVAFHGHLAGLGYGLYPDSGLGNERRGLFSSPPWKKKFTQASVSFGHEITVTLWQHAQALATVMRGGHFRPLRTVKAVEWNGTRQDLPLREDHPLQAHDPLGSTACAEVRDMMRLGATIGTGRDVCKDLHELVDVGTKTGTAQKVGGELCLHLELQHNLEHGCRGAKACRQELAKHGKPPHARCYTSSICAVGKLREGGREVMVLVVVDEPRSNRHFGSQVAGPAGIGILKEALGLTHLGEAPLEIGADGFHAIEAAMDAGAGDQPWAEEAHAPR